MFLIDFPPIYFSSSLNHAVLFSFAILGKNAAELLGGAAIQLHFKAIINTDPH